MVEFFGPVDEGAFACLGEDVVVALERGDGAAHGGVDGGPGEFLGVAEAEELVVLRGGPGIVGVGIAWLGGGSGGGHDWFGGWMATCGSGDLSFW